jgi:GTPase SAR1 family protein
MTIFGQLVFGPPGSGKTKYCFVMQQVLASLGRTVFVVNLDPANDQIYYDCQLNIFDLINVQDVMINCKLGPNGSMLYCMEFLEKNVEWLIDNLEKMCTKKNDTDSQAKSMAYILFDLPGQVELYTHHKSIRNIIEKLVKLDYRLCSVNLVDSYYITDPSKYISVLLMSLSSMLQIELPHVNVFSKMDLIKQYGRLQFSLDFYTDVLDLNYLTDTLDSDRFLAKFKTLNKKICDVVQDFNLVSYVPLNIQKKKSIIRCIQAVDQANGYLFGHMDDQEMMGAVAGDFNDIEDEDTDDDEDPIVNSDTALGQMMSDIKERNLIDE